MWALSVLLIFLFLGSTNAAAAVLGIDLGTEYIKAAIAKPGAPIDVVLTKDSKRKEAAAVAFKPSRAQINDPDAFPERLYGGDALALSVRFADDVYPNLKPLLGLTKSNEEVKAYTNRYPGLRLESIPSMSERNPSGSVGFRSTQFGDQNGIFRVEELLAMELKNIKANAEAGLVGQSTVTDAVITYPAFWTAEEKRALELAAELAGLRVLGLISDGLAVGLNYATTRTFESVTEGARPEYHLIYDMGAGSTTATVLKFQGRTVKDYGKRNKTIQEVQVLSTSSDRSLGGDLFNDVIVDDMIEQFCKKDKLQIMGLLPIHVKRHAKTKARFLKEASRMRQMLSANSLATANLEGVYYEDTNFKYSLQREYYEKLIKSYVGRVGEPLVAALDAAGITLADLDSIILHGGVVRTPFVQKQLEIAAGGGDKIKTNVNADEAAVMGAAFKAASLSPSFRVKDIRASDIGGSAYSLEWTVDGKGKQQKLFTPNSLVGIEKQVPVNSLQDVTFHFHQITQTEDMVSMVEATNLTKSVAELQSKGCAAANISTVFNMRLSPVDGLPEITSGSVSCKVDTIKDSVLDNVKGLFGFGKKEAEQKVLEDEEGTDAEPMTPLPVSDPTSSGTIVSSPSETASASETSSNSTSSSAKATKAAKPIPTVVTIPLKLESRPLGLNTIPTASLPTLKDRLEQFDASDRNSVLRAEALNSLEGFTYRARDYLSDESFLAVAGDKVQQELESALSAASEWLYGEGVDAKLADFKEKLKGLKTIVDPVLKRKEESTGREKAVQSLRDGLDNTMGMMKMINGSILMAAEAAASSASSAASSIGGQATSIIAPASSAAGEDDLEDDPYVTATSSNGPEETDIPIPKPYEYTAEDLSSLTKVYDTVKSWLDEKVAAQEKLKPYEDPAMLISDLETRASQLQSSISDVVMKSIKMQDIPKKPKKNNTKKPKSKKGKGSSSASVSSETETNSATASSTTTSSIIHGEL